MTEVGGIAAEQLRSYIERAERIQEEIDALNADKSDIFKEAKSNGFCTKTMKKIIQLRKLPEDQRNELEHLEALYKRAMEEAGPSHVRVHEAAE